MTNGERSYPAPETVDLDELTALETTAEIPQQSGTGDLVESALIATAQMPPPDIGTDQPENPPAHVRPALREAEPAYLPGATASDILANLPPEKFARLYNGLVDHARRQTRSNGVREAEDFAATTVTKFIEKGEGAHGRFHNVRQLYGYLRATLSNTIIDEYRQNSQRPGNSAGYEPFEGEHLLTAPSETLVIGNITVDTITKMLAENDNFDEERRVIFFELLYQTMSREELAEMLGISNDALRRRIYRIRQALADTVLKLTGTDAATMQRQQRSAAATPRLNKQVGTV